MRKMAETELGECMYYIYLAWDKNMFRQPGCTNTTESALCVARGHKYDRSSYCTKQSSLNVLHFVIQIRLIHIVLFKKLIFRNSEIYLFIQNYI